VGIRKRAILDADLAGRDEQLGAAVNKKRAKTRNLTQKSRDSRLGFLCLPDWRSFAPKMKGSPKPTLCGTSLGLPNVVNQLTARDCSKSVRFGQACLRSERRRNFVRWVNKLMLTRGHSVRLKRQSHSRLATAERFTQFDLGGGVEVRSRLPPIRREKGQPVSRPMVSTRRRYLGAS
jgi:hypothetical protein